MTELRRVEQALLAIRAPVVLEEGALHRLVEEALSAAGLNFRREARLGLGARVDFLCEGVAVEVKRGRPLRKPLHNQLSRYAAFDEVTALLVVLERWTDLPHEIGGKPVKAISLRRLWGVTLP